MRILPASSLRKPQLAGCVNQRPCPNEATSVVIRIDSTDSFLRTVHQSESREYLFSDSLLITSMDNNEHLYCSVGVGHLTRYRVFPQRRFNVLEPKEASS